jgi:Flp pilus assembly protein TadD
MPTGEGLKMSNSWSNRAARGMSRAAGALLVAALGLLAGACSQAGSPKTLLEAAPSLAGATNPPAADNRTELQKATEYWGKEYAKHPNDAEKALNYARNLKALGEKRQALAVLQQISVFHGTNRAVNAEYGRLALEFDQVSLAQKLLAQADDPGNPDWRVVSARGTVLAKQGLYRDAIAFYERARALAPEEPSVLNNLALAYTMEGKPEQAEPLLKQAMAMGGAHEARVSHNLALVRDLQGRPDEDKLAAAPAPITTGAVAEPQAKTDKTDKKSAAKPAAKGKLASTADTGEEDKSGWSTQVAVNARR